MFIRDNKKTPNVKNKSPTNSDFKKQLDNLSFIALDFVCYLGFVD
jgi:hypothetical protein